jgi:hypothetical protein
MKLHRKLRASELMVVAGAGHSVFEEMPEEANRIVLGWLARHPLAAAAAATRARAAAPSKAGSIRRLTAGTSHPA